MKRAWLFTIVWLIIGSMTSGLFAAEPYSVGEKWTYKHEGAVPMRPPDFVMQGDRTREVVGTEGDGDAKCWLIQEQWGAGDEWIAKTAVNAKRMYGKIVAAEDRVTTLRPEYPYALMDLKPDEAKTVESTFSMGENWSIPVTLTAKRVKDETLIVPAGEFENCIHVEIEESLTFSPPDRDPMTITTKRQQWFHPKVNGLVKEIFSIQGGQGEARKGTSELKEYTKAKSE